MNFSRFDGLLQEEQAALLAYFNDLEQEDISSQEEWGTDDYVRNDGKLCITDDDYGWIASDVTGADILEGSDSSGVQQ